MQLNTRRRAAKRFEDGYVRSLIRVAAAPVINMQEFKSECVPTSGRDECHTLGHVILIVVYRRRVSLVESGNCICLQ